MTLNNTHSSAAVSEALEQFVSKWLQWQKQNSDHPLKINYDSQWPSSCYQQDPNATDLLQEGDDCQWLPVRQPSQDMFSRLNSALDIEVHPDIVAYYCHFWSNHLAATSEFGELELLQVWNQEDMERLRSNILGHALDKKRRRQPVSIFFAITSPEEGMLSVNNDSAEVWFEVPGKKPVRKVANSLAEFLQSLSPALENEY